MQVKAAWEREREDLTMHPSPWTRGTHQDQGEEVSRFQPQYQGRVSRFQATKPAETTRSEDRWRDREACVEAKQSREGAVGIS